MPVRIEKNKNLTTDYLSGEIDHHSAAFLREAIDKAAVAVNPKELNLDFMGVSFMDSSGIGLVMGRYKLMKAIGGRLRVSNVSPAAMRVMKLAGLDLLAKIDCK